MPLIDTLEKKLGHLAIPHSVRILALFQAAVWFLMNQRPAMVETLMLSPHRVMEGEVWRLFTWVFIAGGMHWLIVIFALLLTFMVGEGLEQAWGAFRVNLYLLGGIVAVDVGTMFFGGLASGVFFDTSILFAFAYFFPDFEIMVYFVIPMKMRWVAALSAAYLVIEFVSTDILRVTIFCSVLNFLVAFGPRFLKSAEARSSSLQRRARFAPAQGDGGGVHFHKCATCGKTDADDPHLEFRVTPDGEEYCNVCRPLKTSKPAA